MSRVPSIPSTVIPLRYVSVTTFGLPHPQIQGTYDQAVTTRLLSPGQAEEPPAPGSHEKLDRLRTLLREMFQLDRGDLDFGLYRIMNLKSAEIIKFLDEDLLPQVKTSLRLTSAEDREALSERLKSAREQAYKLGYNPDAQPSDVIIDLNHRLEEMRKDAAVEADVYNHLANFFGRYYSEGDFISQRRYSTGGRSSYLIPYDGEEVKLHWANADQYYIKTTENYASYAFTVDAGEAARRVCFEIAAADNEKDNVKEPDGKQRRFVLAGTDAVGVEDGDLVVRFEHRPLTQGEKKAWPGNGGSQQRRINEVTVGRILSAVDSDWQAPLSAAAPTEANGERSLLAKHVERYTAKNTFDYFIHKDLGGFLRRELDLYLNTEVLNLDDVERGDAARLDRALARVRAIRHIGGKIIDFLAQLEDFQKQLWLKKKFVLETNWCVTLDRVPEEMYPEIAANAAQCEEWVELFAVDEINGDLANGNTSWNNPPSPDFLKANPYLVLDTKHFPRDFTDRLLAALSDAGPLDEQMDGLLIHGENFQALNLLQARYQGQIQCIYIDPPYNTGSDGFSYKDYYQHSSWISMFMNRIDIARRMQSSQGTLFFSIDEIELAHAWLCMQQVYGVENFASDIIWEKKKKPSFLHQNIGKLTDFILAFNKEKAKSVAYSVETTTEGKLTPLNNAGNPLGVLRFHAGSVEFGCGDGLYRAQDMSNGNIMCRLLDDVIINNGVNINTFRMEGEWRYSQDKLDQVAGSEDKLYISRIPFRPNHIKQGGEAKKMKNILSPNHYDMETNEDGTRQIVNMFGRDVFDNPKPEKLIRYLLKSVTYEFMDAVMLDFFAGSGTTGHSVIKLNREDGGQRRYLLVEMADCFDAVLLPRLKKVTYSSEWSGGRPVSRKGSTQIFKYVRLECYEDALSSLEIAAQPKDQTNVLTGNPELAEDYRLRYSLGEETAGSACLLGRDFKDPFSYTLPIVRDGIRSEINVDLPETFNYLIGLSLESRRWLDGVLTITGKDAEGRSCLILWRNRDEIDYDTLDSWFIKSRTALPEQLDLIYVNGDHTLNAVRQPQETWIAETSEPVFRELMFRSPGSES